MGILTSKVAPPLGVVGGEEVGRGLSKRNIWNLQMLVSYAI